MGNSQNESYKGGMHPNSNIHGFDFKPRQLMENISRESFPGILFAHCIREIGSSYSVSLSGEVRIGLRSPEQ